MSFRILIADDEALIRLDLTELLTASGYTVVGEAEDGYEARQLAEQLKPDVLILDVVMPRVGGIKLASELSGTYPIILLTAHSSPDLVQAASDAGVMAYLTKPFHHRDVAAAIVLAVSHFVREAELSSRVVALQQQLETRKLVERAKAILMQLEDIPEPQAYRRLQEISMTRNLTLQRVAQTIIDSV